MSAEPLSCPYCNAQFPAPAGLQVGQKVPCPNCDETFTLCHTPSTDVQPPPAVTPAARALPNALVAPSPPTPVLRTKPVGANRVVALVVLAAMLVMACTGLVFALWTTGDRRAHDTGISRRTRRPGYPSRPIDLPQAALPPARLAALGYLPADVGLVVGLHVEELQATPVGKELLRQSFPVGDRQFRLDEVLAWTSLKLDAIDHAVLGLRPEAALASATLVVRTRQPYDEKAVRTALQAHRLNEGKRAVYRIEIPNLVVRPNLVCPDDRTLVVTLAPDSLPEKPVEGLQNLAAPLRNLLEERMGPGGPVWVAAHAADWKETPAGLLLPRLAPPQRDLLTAVRTFGIWVQPGPSTGQGSLPITVLSAVACASEEKTRELEEKVLAPRLQPEQGANAPVRLVREGAWLTVQVRTDLANLRTAWEKNP